MPYPRPLVAAATAVGLLLLVCAIVRLAFWTYGADTGTFAIAIHNVPHGMGDPFEGGSHFRYHWSPILVTLYPLLALTRTALALQIVQICLVVGSVFAYYSLIEPYLGRALATRCALVALLYPPLLGLAFSEFHELAFAPLLTLGALCALVRRKFALYALAAVLLVCVREDVALLTAFFGAALALWAWRVHDLPYARAGAATAIGAAATMMVYFGAIVPRVGGWGPASFYTYPLQRGPIAVLAQLLTVTRLTYVLEMLAPLAFVPFLTPWFWLTIPPLVIVLTANSGLVWRMGMHYVALWLPWILVAFAAGAARIRERRGERAALRSMNVATALCIAVLIFFNPAHPAHYLVPGYRDDAAAARALSCVPQNAVLGTHDEWYSAMALRHPEITIGTPRDAEYYLFADDYSNDAFRTVTLPKVRRQVARGDVREVCRTNNVAVYRRIRQ